MCEWPGLLVRHTVTPLVPILAALGRSHLQAVSAQEFVSDCWKRGLVRSVADILDVIVSARGGRDVMTAVIRLSSCPTGNVHRSMVKSGRARPRLPPRAPW